MQVHWGLDLFSPHYVVGLCSWGWVGVEGTTPSPCSALLPSHGSLNFTCMVADVWVMLGHTHSASKGLALCIMPCAGHGAWGSKSRFFPAGPSSCLPCFGFHVCLSWSPTA